MDALGPDIVEESVCLADEKEGALEKRMGVPMEGRTERVCRILYGVGEEGGGKEGGREGGRTEGEHARAYVWRFSPSDKWWAGGRKSECVKMIDEE